MRTLPQARRRSSCFDHSGPTKDRCRTLKEKKKKKTKNSLATKLLAHSAAARSSCSVLERGTQSHERVSRTTIWRVSHGLLDLINNLLEAAFHGSLAVAPWLVVRGIPFSDVFRLTEAMFLSSYRRGSIELIETPMSQKRLREPSSRRPEGRP